MVPPEVHFSSEARQALLQLFLGPKNRGLRFDAEGKVEAELRPFVRLAERPESTVFFLPEVSYAGEVAWYFFASDRSGETLTADLVDAFLGRDLSLSLREPSLHGGPLLSDVSALLPKSHFQILPLHSRCRTETREMLRRCASLLVEGPTVEPALALSSSELLTDFRYSLEAGNIPLARETLSKLATGSHLSANNLLFLEVELLALENGQEAVLQHERLPQLLGLRRPAKTTAILFEAVYTNHLRKLIQEELHKEVLSVFREQVVPNYPGLLTSRNAITSEAAIALFTLQAMSSEPPALQHAEDLVALLGPDRAVRRSLETLIAKATRVPEDQARPDLRALLQQQRYDEVLEVIPSRPTETDEIRALLVSAYEVDTLDASGRAFEALSGLEESALVQVLNSRHLRSVWRELRALFPAEEGPSLPSGWREWLEGLRSVAFCQRAHLLAERGLAEWPPSDWETDPSHQRELAELILADHPAHADAALRRSLPMLVEGFRLLESPNPPGPILDALLDYFALTGLKSGAEAIVVQQLVGIALSLGPTRDRYEQALALLSSAWTYLASPKYLEFGLDSLDLLVDNPQVVPAAAQEFFTKFHESFRPWQDRLRPSHVTLFNRLAGELGLMEFSLPLAERPGEGAADFHALQRMTIGLYSLTPGVALRVSNALEELAPGVKVSSSSAMVADNELRALAANSDLMVIAVRSAKHAATEFIREVRGKQPTLIAPGKGSASMLRVILDHCQGGGS